MSKLNTTVSFLTALCAGTCVAQPAFAQADAAKDYPNKPVRLIAPFVAGAGTDFTARTIAQKLSEKWGQQFIVDNRTGAGGTIGVDLTAKAVPDGYTICLISASLSVNAATNSRLPYDLTKDLQAITQASFSFLRGLPQPIGPGNFDQGADRVRQGEPRQTQLRIFRHRQACSTSRARCSTIWQASRSLTCRTRARPP